MCPQNLFLSPLLLFLLLQCPGLGWVGANHRGSGQNKKMRRDSCPSPRWRGPSCRDGLSPGRTFPPLAVPQLAVPRLALPSRSAVLADPLLSRAGGARSMPPNTAQNVPPVAHQVPPGPHRRHVNSYPREREGGYRPTPPDLPGGYRPPERLLLQLQRLSSSAGFRLTRLRRCVYVWANPLGWCVCVCVCVVVVVVVVFSH